MPFWTLFSQPRHFPGHFPHVHIHVYLEKIPIKFKEISHGAQEWEIIRRILERHKR